MSARKDLAGKKFGRWTFVSFSHWDKKSYWFCLCECGKEKVARASEIIYGVSKSCGCLARENSSKRKAAKTHGMSRTRAYSVWRQMKYRCQNPTNKNYGKYGGRGISVSESWIKFETFLADMGHPPKGFTIDRIDNNGPYCKGNCRWATYAQQNINRRNTAFLIIRGEKIPLKVIADQNGIDLATIRTRLKRGWTQNEAISTPVQVRKW